VNFRLIVTYLQFPVHLLLFSHGRPFQQFLSSCFPHVTLNFDLMTLTLKLDLDSVKMNRRVRYLRQRWCRSKVNVRSTANTDTQSHSRPTARPGPL